MQKLSWWINSLELREMVPIQEFLESVGEGQARNQEALLLTKPLLLSSDRVLCQLLWVCPCEWKWLRRREMALVIGVAFAPPAGVCFM